MALSEFEKAFKSARASGDKVFEFKGKKYNTKYKEEGSAPAKKAASKDRDALEAKGLAGNKAMQEAEEKEKIAPAPYKPKLKSELSPAERKKRDEMESSQALEGSHPELLFNPARTVLGAVARPLESADKVRSAVTTGVNAIKNSAPAKAVREARFTKAASKDADDIAAAGQAKETAEAVSRANKFLPDEAFSFKRGGAVKKMAFGGSVSASRRGDGIAQRGKTRGRMC
jgi:hypothetical protein